MTALYHIKFFYILIQALFAQSLITDAEFSITMDLVQNLGIQEFTYIGGNVTNSKTIPIVKKFSTANIPFTYLCDWQANDYIRYQTFYSKIGVILKENAMLHIRDITQIYAQYKVTYVMSKFTWLVLVENLQKQPFLAHEHFNIPFDCEFIIINELEKNYYELLEIYDIKNNGFLVLFGKWDLSLGVEIINKKSFYSKRIDFNGTLLTEVEQKIHFCPYVLYTCNVMEIILSLAAKMNFRVSRDFVELENPLIQSISNVYDGDFYNEKQNYYQIGKKIGPLYNNKFACLIKSPERVLLPDYYLRPFETFIWKAIFSFIIILAIASLIINCYIGKKNRRNWIDDLFVGVELICNQCGNDDIDNISLSIVFIVLQITIVVLMSAHGAFITSFLAINKAELPFKNANEFLKNGEYKLGVEYGFSDHAILLAYGQGIFKNSVLEKIVKDHMITFNYETSAEYLKKLCAEKIITTDFPFTPKYRKELRCSLFPIPEPFLSYPLAIFINDNSSFQDMFQIVFLQFYVEAGIRNEIQKILDEGGALRHPIWLGSNFLEEQIVVRIHMRFSDKFLTDQESDFFCIEISQIYQVLILPLVGIFLSVLILITEIFIKVFSVTVFQCMQSF